MTLWVFDTDCLSLLQRGHPQINQRIQSVDPEHLAVTIVTVEEQLYGRLNRISRSPSGDALILAYAKLRETVDDFNQLNLLDFDLPALTEYQKLIHQRIRIGTQDLKIGAIALKRSVILVLRNRRDFEQIPGWQWSDWPIAPEE